MSEDLPKSRSGPTAMFVGCGDIGIRCGQRLSDRDWAVHAVRRNISKLPASFVGHSLDYSEPGSLNFIAAQRPEIVVATLNPLERSEAGYRRGFVEGMKNLLRALADHKPTYILMSSSTRVYAERDGGWVDESSALAQDDPLAGCIVEAEQLLLDSDHPSSVVRFGGIYGKPNGRLLSRIGRGEICAPEPVHYTNRIHRSDCAAFLLHLIDLSMANGSLSAVYNGVDDNPAPRYEVESWLARRLEVDAGQGAEGVSGLNPRATSGHKRCRNDALKASGYRLQYPDYRAGYGALLAQN